MEYFSPAIDEKSESLGVAERLIVGVAETFFM